MKITAADKIQGLRRLKEYREDYLEYARAPESQTDCIVGTIAPSIRLSPKGRRLCREWDIQFPVNPFANAEGHHLPNFPDLAPTQEPGEWYFTPVRHPRKDELATARVVGIAGSPDDGIVTHDNDGRLILSIDPTCPLDTLMKSIKTLLTQWGAKKSTEKSDRPHSYDIWEVHDLYEGLPTDRRTYAAVAWAIDIQTAKQDGVAPRINDADIKGVERAYKKACKIMNHIRISAKK